MGLDAVEMVMEIEDAFGIAIEDAEAEKIRTPRQLINLVKSKVATGGVQSCMSQRAFHRIRRALMVRLGLSRKLIHPHTRLESLIPMRGRRSAWYEVGRDTKSARWPELQPGLIPLALGLLAGTAVTITVQIRWGLSVQALVALWLTSNLVLIALFLRLWRPLNFAFPANCRTVVDLTVLFVRNNPEVCDGGRRAWGEAEVAMIVRKIIEDALAVKDFSDDADFVKDLGMG